MLKYERDEKEVRQQVTKRGERERRKTKFSPQSLIIKIIKSSKSKKSLETYLMHFVYIYIFIYVYMQG